MTVQVIVPSAYWAFAVDVKASTMNISASKIEVFFKAAIFLSFYPQEVYVTYVSCFHFQKCTRLGFLEKSRPDWTRWRRRP